MAESMDVDHDMLDTSAPPQVGERVLVFSKHAGVIQYVSSDRQLIGVHLDRPYGDSDGMVNGDILFECKEHYGVFVRPDQLQRFSHEDAAACVLQSTWRKWTAIQKFRRLVNIQSWNVLDNNEEQLNLIRNEKFKSAEQALTLLANKKPLHRSPSVAAVESIQISPDYTGPHIQWPLTIENVMSLLESFKTGEILHSKYLLQVIKEAITILSPRPTLQEVQLKEGETITVVGDLHGQLQDLFTIFSLNGLPSPTNKYLFNGDFVDRGRYGTEVVLCLLCFLILYPDSIYLNRGNHESRNQNTWMGFEDELWSKYTGFDADDDPERANYIFERFQSLFESLPLCCILQDKIFVAHGGLFSRDNVTLAHLRAVKRKREPPLHQTNFEDKIYEDLLWSDPRPIASRQPSERGAGVEFGVEVTNNFCIVNKVALIIRSHECVPEGFEILHGGRLITLFSASRYCGTQMNKGAFLTLGPSLQPEIQQFYAHPIDESAFKLPEDTELQNTLEEDTLRMIAERICDHRPSLFWYFTQHQEEDKGTVPRLVWAEALKSVLQLDLPFLTYQARLADADDDTGRINYSRFLTRYRIENDAVDKNGWQESLIARICKKLFRAMGAGDVQQAFKVFDTDQNGYIEYEEFMSTLKKMDTGLADQQVYELMRTADANDDGRIDFSEFAQRFELIFTRAKNAPPSPSSNSSSLDSPSAMAVDKDSTRPPSPLDKKESGMRRRVSTIDEFTFTPTPATDVDIDTMAVLVKIGRTLFAMDGSLQDHFTRFDINQDGVLQREEFAQALQQLGFTLSPDLFSKVMTAVDTDAGDSIDYKEFVSAFGIQDLKERDGGGMTWQSSVLQQVSNVLYQHRIHIRNAFRMFDRGNTGYISKDEFRTGIKTFNAVLNSPLSDDQVEELLDFLDTNNDGVVSYREFLDGFRVVDVQMVEEE